MSKFKEYFDNYMNEGIPSSVKLTKDQILGYDIEEVLEQDKDALKEFDKLTKNLGGGAWDSVREKDLKKFIDIGKKLIKKYKLDWNISQDSRIKR